MLPLPVKKGVECGKMWLSGRHGPGFVLPPVLRRRQACDGLKLPVKIGDVVEPTFVGNIRNSITCFDEQ